MRLLKLRLRDADLTGEEMTIVADPKRRQLVSTDMNEKEAIKMFKELPWAEALIGAKYTFFRHD